MATLSELRVIARYDGKELKTGTQQAIADMEKTSAAIKSAADQAEVAVKAATTKMGASYARLPVEARQALDAAASAHEAYSARVTQTMMTVGAALSLGITVPFALAAKTAVDQAATFERSLDVLQVSIGGTGEQMERLRQKAIELGADMSLPSTSAVSAANAMTQLAKAGLNVQKVLEASRGTMQLAAATGIDSAEAAVIQARALEAFSLSGDKATHVADLLTKSTYQATHTIEDMKYALASAGTVLSKSGQSIDDTVTALTALSKAGIVGSDAGTSLKQMFLRLEEAGTMKRVRELMHLYGVEVYDASGHMKSMRDIIGAFTPMMENLTEKQRNAALAVIFGTDAIRAAQVVLGNGVEKYDALRAKLEDEGAAAHLAAARNKGLAGAVDGLRAAWETLLKVAASPALGFLSGIVRGVASAVNALTAMDPAMRAVIIGVTALAAAVGPTIVLIGTMRNAWASMIGLGAQATAAKAAQAAADVALAVTAQAAAAAEMRLAAGEALAGDAALAEVAPTLAAASAKAALAGASNTATGGLGLLSIGAHGASAAIGFLATPVGLVAAAVALFVGGLIYANKIQNDAQAEADQSTKALRREHEEVYEAAKAAVELAKQTGPLLKEYLKLHEQRDKNEIQVKREKELSNQIADLQPSLVKAYKATGDAILDVAKAHEEAAKQAQKQLDKEMALADSHVATVDAVESAQRSSDLREQGAGKSVKELEKMGGYHLQEAYPGDLNSSYVRKETDLQQGPILDALEKYWAARDKGEGDALKAEAELTKVVQLQNAELLKSVNSVAAAQRKAHEEHLKSTMSAADYAKHVAEEEHKNFVAKTREEEEAEKKRLAYQDASKKQLMEDYKAGRIDKRTAAGLGLLSDDEANNLPDRKDMKKATPAEILKGWKDELKATAHEFGLALTSEFRKGAHVHGGHHGLSLHAQSEGKEKGKALDFFGSQAELLAMFNYIKETYKANVREMFLGLPGGGQVVRGRYNPVIADPLTRADHSGKRLHLHAALTEGLGVTAEHSTAEDAANKAIDYLIGKHDEALKKQKELQNEIESSFKKAERATSGLTDGNAKYAEMLGMELKLYNQLDEAHKRRAESDFAARSQKLASKEIGVMQGQAAAEAIQDPVDRQVAQYKLSLAENKSYSEADKARLIDEKRQELVDARSREVTKEVEKLKQETQLLGVVNEQERIRLQLLMSHPDVRGDAGKSLYGNAAGLLAAGNIDLQKRPIHKNEDGSISTVRSMSFEQDGYEILVPTIDGSGRLLTNQQAMELYKKTGQFLGKFDTADHATAFAKDLHNKQDQYYGQGATDMDALATGEYDKYQAERHKAAQDELKTSQQTTELTKLQVAHDVAAGKAATNLLLTEAQRYHVLGQIDDELELATYRMEEQLKVTKGELTDADAQLLIHAKELGIQQARNAKDEIEHTKELEKAQADAHQRLADRMQKQQETAQGYASSLANILVKPFEDSGKGIRSFWKTLGDTWRQTVQGMVLDWAKSSLAKVFEPMFEGHDVRKYKADEAAKAKAIKDEQAALLKGMKAGNDPRVVPGTSNEPGALPGITSAATAQMTVTATNVVINGNLNGSANPMTMTDGTSSCMAGNTCSGMPGGNTSTVPGTTAGGGATTMGQMNMGNIMMLLGMLSSGAGKKGGILGDIGMLVSILGMTGAFGNGTKGSKGWLHFAAGGSAPFKPVVVGEYGPEVWMPPESGGRILNNGQAGNVMSGGGGGVNVTVNMPIQTPDHQGFRRSQRQIASEFGSSIANEARRNFRIPR